MMRAMRQKVVAFCALLVIVPGATIGLASTQGTANTQARDPGVSDTSIVIGTVVPMKGSLASIGGVVKAVITSYFDDLNSKGGINGRRVEIKFVETGDTPAGTKANVERLIRDEHIFALSSPLIAGAESEMLALAEEQKIPIVCPLTLYPKINTPLNRQVFYLMSGLDIQARAFVDFMSKTEGLKGKNVGIVHTNIERDVSVIAAVRDQTKKNGMNAVLSYPFIIGTIEAAGILKQLRAANRDLVFFLGPADDALLLIKEAARVGWFPNLFLGGGAGPGIFDLPMEFNEKIFLSFGTAPQDQTDEGVAEFFELIQKYKLSTDHKAAQVTALASAKVLGEGLKRAGKDLSREKLIQSLESLSNFATGLTQPVTYGPTRRLGVQGAYIIKIDLKEKNFVPAGWVNVN